jgi:hypothetical protein
VKLAPHLPADPQKKNAAGEKKAKYLQQLRCNKGACDPENGRSKNADENGAIALFAWKPCRGKSYDDGIISCQHQVDHDDLGKARDGGAADYFGHGSSRADSSAIQFGR